MMFIWNGGKSDPEFCPYKVLTDNWTFNRCSRKTQLRYQFSKKVIFDSKFGDEVNRLNAYTLFGWRTVMQNFIILPCIL